MKNASSSPRPARSARSIHRFVPIASFILLVLSRTALHQTRFADSAFGLGLGLLSVSSILTLFPSFLQPREPEDSDLQTLDLSR